MDAKEKTSSSERLFITPETPREFEYISGTDIREPITGRELAYRPWEATPLIPHALPEARAHQFEVDSMIRELIAKASFPPEAAALSNQYFMSNNMRLGYDNQASYDSRLELVPELVLDNQMLEVHEKGLRGTASMVELRALRAALGMPSIELGKVTFVDGMRSEYVSPMFAELSTTLGEEITMSNPYQLEVVGFDDGSRESEAINAMVISYKRYHNTAQDGVRVKEGSSFVIRTDPESGFDQELMHAIKKIAGDDLELVAQLRRVRSIFNEVIEQGASHPLVCAGITKLYEYDAITAERIKQRNDVVRKKRLAETAFDISRIYFVNHGSGNL